MSDIILAIIQQALNPIHQLESLSPSAFSCRSCNTEMQVFSTRKMGSAVALSSILTAAASSEIDVVDCSLTLGISNEGSMSRSMVPVTLNLFDYQTFVDKNEDCAISSATHDRICWGGGAICTALPSWSDMKPHLPKLNIEEPSLELKLSPNEDRKEDTSPSSEARFEGLESKLMKGRNGGSPTPGKSRVSESNGAKSCTRDGDNGELQRICCDCGTMKTPLWRNGPRGPKSLCNACGIRFKKSGRSRVVGGNIHGAKRKVESSSYEALQCFRRYGLPNKEEIRCETTFKLPLPPLARACSSISLSVNATNTRYLCPTMYATASSMAGEPDISSRRSQWNDHDQKEGALSLMHMSRHLTSRRPPFVT